MYFKNTLAKEAQYGIISAFKKNHTVVINEDNDYYEYKMTP